MRMASTGVLVLVTALLTPVLYAITKAVYWVIGWWRRAVHIDRVPGLEKHWWYGNIHQVCTLKSGWAGYSE